MAAKIYYVTPGTDGWRVEILDEDSSGESSGLEEAPVILGGGWIGAEQAVVHRAVVTQRPDGSLASEYSARRILQRKVPRRAGRRR